MSSAVALLMTYNQEAYVRDAALDVLSQDLEDLKVVFSDDASTDGTFEILLDVASAYTGPKHLVVRRNRRNLGMNLHINRLVSDTSEEILIPFSGDDRFERTRARMLVDLLTKEGAWLAHSNVGFIDHFGEDHYSVHSGATFYGETSAEASATSEALFIGASAAWKRRLFEKYGPLPNSKAYEDLILGFRAALEGGVEFAPEKLVSYRVAVGRSFNEEATVSKPGSLEGKLFALERRRDVMAARLNDCANFGLEPNNPLTLKIKKEYQNSVKAILQISDKARVHQLISQLEEKCVQIDKLNQELKKSSEALSLAQKQLESTEIASAEANTLRNLLQAISGVVFRGVYGKLVSSAIVSRIRSSDIVDEKWYLDEYPDVRDAGHNPIKHFLLHGLEEGRLPRSLPKVKQ